MKLYQRATGKCLAENVLLANTAWTRLRGLIGRQALAEGDALWLRPCNGVHTFWMRFTIDVIYLDEHLRIVKLIKNLRPFRLAPPSLKTFSVIEMPENSIARLDLHRQDQLRIEK